MLGFYREKSFKTKIRIDCSNLKNTALINDVLLILVNKCISFQIMFSNLKIRTLIASKEIQTPISEFNFLLQLLTIEYLSYKRKWGGCLFEELLMPWASTQADGYSKAEVLKQDKAEWGSYLPHRSQRKGEAFTEQDCSNKATPPNGASSREPLRAFSFKLPQ